MAIMKRVKQWLSDYNKIKTQFTISYDERNILLNEAKDIFESIDKEE